MNISISMLLKIAIEQKASDLHVSEGLKPKIRIDGKLQDMDFPDIALIAQPSVTELLKPLMTEAQLMQFHEKFELDFSVILPDLGRFRVNVFKQDKGVSAAFRIIPAKISTLEELGLPPIIKQIAELPHGLILVTGPTGSGKTTTLASIIDYINQFYYKHIITIEDPIEFSHISAKCLIHQREVSRDTHTFNNALRAVLREDPDIILVGEMRDLDSVRLALMAAETGHLVLGTLHTASAAKTINRITDIFPVGGERNLIQTMLSESLQAVISQTLVRRYSGGRVAALEILLCSPAIRSLIREDKIAQIYSAMQTSGKLGMQTLDQDLKKLLDKNIISLATAKATANSKELFN